MNEEQLNRLEEKVDKLTVALIGDEKDEGFFQRVRSIEKNCKRNHQSIILKYGPFMVSLGMFCVAAIALYYRVPK